MRCRKVRSMAIFILTGIALILLSFALPTGSEEFVLTGSSFGTILLIAVGFSSLRTLARRRADR